MSNTMYEDNFNNHVSKRHNNMDTACVCYYYINASISTRVLQNTTAVVTDYTTSDL